VYDNWKFFYRPDFDLKKSFEVDPPKAKHSLDPAAVEYKQQSTIPAQNGDGLHRTTSTTSGSTSVAKDASLNRMVDALVSDTDGLEPLPEETNNLPVTPPVNPEYSLELGHLSNAAAPLTASDLVLQVQNWGHHKASVITHTPAYGSPASLHGRHTSSPHQPNDLWAQSSFHSGPSSPYQAAAPYSTRSPTTGAVQNPYSAHSRGGSISSLQPLYADASNLNGRTSRPSTAHTVTPTLTRSNQIEEMRDVWGVMPNVPTAEWVRMRQPRYGESAAPNSITSSALFGAGGGPWSTAPTRSNTSHMADWSPMNGQGG
jgi:hypothetical protein